jgi:uncharacterized membrane protein
MGIVHTVISVVAVAAGVYSLLRYRSIAPDTSSGKTYIVMTILTCLTGFFIFAHGGFGKPHALGVLTLMTLAVAALAGATGLFGKAAAAVQTVAYSLTFFFHMIPGVTETTTRLPVASPIFENADAQGLQAIAGVLFVVFLIGAVLQVRRLGRRAAVIAMTAPDAHM